MYRRITALAVLFVLLFGVVLGRAAYAAGSTITLYEMPSSDPNRIEIVKESNGKTITSGTAYFKVEYFPNTNWSGSPARTWYYKTVNGVTRLGDKTYYVASCDYGKSDALYENVLGAPTIPLGTIRITEAAAPEGYLKSNFKLEGKIVQPSNGVEATFQWTSQKDNIIRYVEDTAYIHNDQIKGNLKIVKKDAYEDIPLEGAGFRILDIDGKTVAEGYTDKNGEVTFKDLPYGKNYTYQEFKAPEGYKLNENKHPFTITENGVTVTKEKLNYRRDGTLQVRKQDANGSALSGAVFLLEFSTDNGSSWKPVQYREEGDNVTSGGCTSSGLTDGQLTTGKDGIVTFTGLRADKKILYRLTETVAPEGMSLISGPLYVGTLPVETTNTKAEDSETVDGKTWCYTLYVTVTDSALFRLPETGGEGFVLLPFALLLAATPIILTKRKKEII